jgi:hypothetical protein
MTYEIQNSEVKKNTAIARQQLVETLSRDDEVEQPVHKQRLSEH